MDFNVKIADENFSDKYETEWLSLTNNNEHLLNINTLQKLLFKTDLPAKNVEKILGLTIRGKFVQKSEFKFSLALAAYAQQGQEIMMDVVTMSVPPIPYPKLNSNNINNEDNGNGNEDGWLITHETELKHYVKLVLENDKQGFIFTHHNYTIEIQDENSTNNNNNISRRFSDFVWLHYCLLARYPFRNIPNLPPKRLTLSGHSLSTDPDFLETRRRGLERYSNFILNHPILKNDGLVLTFFETQNLEHFRKNTKISLEEESQILNRVKLMSIPLDLDERIDKLKSKIPLLIENWSKLCMEYERILKRNEIDSKDYINVKFSLSSIIINDDQCWNRNDDSIHHNFTNCIEGLDEFSKLYHDKTKQSSLISLESLRYIRDLYIGYLNLLTRADSLIPTTIDKLKINVERSQNKLQTLNQALNKCHDLRERRKFETEIKNQSNVIEQNQSKIQLSLTKRQFGRYCLWTELLQLQSFEKPLIKNGINYLVNCQINKNEDLTNCWKNLRNKLD